MALRAIYILFEIPVFFYSPCTFIAFKKVILSCLTYETDYKSLPDIVKEVQVEVSGRWEGESHMT